MAFMLASGGCNPAWDSQRPLRGGGRADDRPAPRRERGRHPVLRRVERQLLVGGTTTSGPNFWGNRLIIQARALAVNVDVFTIMPFDFGGCTDMFSGTVNAAEA